MNYSNNVIQGNFGSNNVKNEAQTGLAFVIQVGNSALKTITRIFNFIKSIVKKYAETSNTEPAIKINTTIRTYSAYGFMIFAMTPSSPVTVFLTAFTAGLYLGTWFCTAVRLSVSA